MARPRSPSSACPSDRLDGALHVVNRPLTALRPALDLPAVVAMRANPALGVFAERLRAVGECPKFVVVTVMRKLLVLA
jgi:hypothetical protein